MAEEKKGQEVTEDDDFTFDIGKKPGTDDTSVDDGKKDDQKKDDQKKDDDEGKKDQEKKDDKGNEDLSEKDKKDSEKAGDQKSDEGNDKNTSGKDEGEKKDKEKVDEFIDIFAEGEKKDDGKKSDGTKTSYKNLAKDLGIDLENDTEEEFKGKVSKKIEDSRQEFKLDDYPEEAKAVVNHLKKNGGKIEDFLNNQNIISLQGVKNLDPEQKILYVRVNELQRSGLDSDKAQEQANAEIEELDTKEIIKRSSTIDNDADKLIAEEIKKITGDRVIQVEREKAKVVERTKTEISQLKTYVTKQTEFFGIKLSDKAKQTIIRDIDTGAFDDIANKSPESSKFTAYMIAKFGKNILETLNKDKSEQNRKGHNEAIDKSLGALHKTKESAQDKKAGHQKSKTEGEGKFDGFAGALGEDE